MRRNLRRVRFSGAGGINQQIEQAEINQLADARNIYAPSGRLISRPGYRGVSGIGSDGSRSTLPSSNLLYEDVSTGTIAELRGAGLLTLDARTSAQDGDRIYIGFDVDNIDSNVFTFRTGASGSYSSDSVIFIPEYWNGSNWKYLPIKVRDSSEDGGGIFSSSENLGLFTEQEGYHFVPPNDWATREVNSTSAYWIRLTLHEAADTSWSIDHKAGLGSIGINPKGAEDEFAALYQAQFSNKTLWVWVFLGRTPAGSNLAGTNLAVSDPEFAGLWKIGQINDSTNIRDEPGTLAVVPQFDEAFLAYTHNVWRVTPNKTLAPATVEKRNFAVGPNAPYDPGFIAQLGGWPKAKYIQFFKGHLWVSGIDGEPFTVRWSAPAPYHKVWPILNAESIMEHDNSPITGMHPLGEYMVIFKRDSIWVAYDSGINDFGLQTYAIRQIVNGVGCVSNSSIKSIRGNLVFLAEDGIYRFDGQGVEKLSDRIQDTIDSIVPGRRPFSAAAHWRTKSLYMLAVTVGSSAANDLVIVYDYKNDTWWLWDNIEAEHWVVSEDAYDEEVVYFGDSSARLFRMGGKTDYGDAITCSITTQRIGYPSSSTRRFRGVNLWSDNRAASMDAEFRVNDEGSGDTGTYDFTDSNELDWGELNWDPAATQDNWSTRRRRLGRLMYRKTGEWGQVDITHNTLSQPFVLTGFELGIRDLGRR